MSLILASDFMTNHVEENTDIRAYLDKVAHGVQELLKSQLVGLYLHGSSVQSDFHRPTSDIDILGVVSGSLSEAQRVELISQLSHTSNPVPAAGLEIILCPVEATQVPALDFPFEFALSTGSDWSTHSEPPGTASDILINIVLCRQSGCTLKGQSAEKVFAPVTRDLLCRALIEELQWHRRNLLKKGNNSIGENAVLNAARSIHAAEMGEILSKAEGGHWWLQLYPSDKLVAEALARRRSGTLASLDLDRVSDFLEQAITSILKQITP